MFSDQINALILQLKKAEHRQRHPRFAGLAVPPRLGRLSSLYSSAPCVFSGIINAVVGAKPFFHQEAAGF